MHSTQLHLSLSFTFPFPFLPAYLECSTLGKVRKATSLHYAHHFQIPEKVISMEIALQS